MSLTSKDLKKIEKLMDLQLRPVWERMETFVTKDAFYTMMDKIITRFDRLETEYLFLNHRVSDHEDRLSAVESQASG